MGETQGILGLTIALREATELVDRMLELAVGAGSADRAALLLVEDDGTLACRGVSGGDVADELPPADIAGALLAALEAGEPLAFDAADSALPPSWQDTLAPAGLVLAPLVTPEGPLGLLLLGWDEGAPSAQATEAAATAASSLVLVLEAAIESEVERSRSLWQRMPESDREQAGRALAAIYLRSGLLRLIVEDDGPAEDVAEIEALAFEGLRALRRSEESRGAARAISDELFDVLVELTGD